jgi:hypothetical protein
MRVQILVENMKPTGQQKDNVAPCMTNRLILDDHATPQVLMRTEYLFKSPN